LFDKYVMMFSESVARRTLLIIGLSFVFAGVIAGCGKESDESEIPIPQQAAVNFQQAEQAYQVGAYRPALQLVDSVQQEAPDFSGSYVLRGQIFTALERYEDASKQLAQAAELDPGNPAIHFNWANNAYRREQYREAIRRFERVSEMIEEQERVNIYSNDPEGREARHAVFLQMGRAYDDLGKSDSSRMYFERAIEVFPQKAETYHAMSELLEKRGDFEEAISYARRALERDSSNVEYKYGLGILLTQTGRYEEAIPYLQEMAQERSWHHGAHYNLGQAYMQLGQTDRAEEYLSQADSLQQARADLDKLGERAEVNKDNLRLWVKYGSALRQAGRTEDAIRAFRHALSIAPRNVALQNNMAILALEAGNAREAIMRYRAILQRNPELPDVWLNLGVAYANTGEIEQARRAWKKVLEYDSEHTTAKKYLAEYDVTEK
jgi:tetratricopeptide (TPR) repeat protein